MADLSSDSYARLRRTHPELFEHRDKAGYEIIEGPPGSASLCYEDPFIFLIRDWVRFPGGEEGAYLRIVPKGGNGAAILPRVGDNLLLLRHHRHATGRSHLEIPRGFAEPGEAPELTAKRELLEETRLTVREMIALGPLTPDSGLLSSTVYLFLAECEVQSGEVRTESHATAEFMSVASVEAAIAEGLIQDSFTMAAFLRARLRGYL